MGGSGLLGWSILGGLLVLLISETVLALAPYVKQAAEGGIIEVARRSVAGTTGEPAEKVPGHSADGPEDRLRQ